jgi:hypothetical protein
MIRLLSSLKSVIVRTVSLKSVMVRTVMCFFGIINVGEAHCDDDCLLITHIPTCLSISFIRVALCICGMGYGLP